MTKSYADFGQRAEQLSERDWAVLRDLARVRLLSGSQIQRLHVADGSELTQGRRGRALVKRLHDLGFIIRLARRIGGVQAGSAGFIYGLNTLGQHLMTKAGPAGGERLRKPWTPSSSYTAHILGVSELYVRLREAERTSGMELSTFAAEPAAWRRWQSWNGEQRTLKPDAFVITAVEELEHHAFVELDRATQSRTVIRAKAEEYIAYWRGGLEQARFEVFPRVLFVVPNEARRAQLVDVLAQLDPEAWQLFQVCTDDQAPHVMLGRPPP